MTILRVELDKNFPPLVMDVTKAGHNFRSYRYYTLGDYLTCDLEDVFEGGNHCLNDLLHGGRVRFQDRQAGDGIA
jgi:hypothetical protein